MGKADVLTFLGITGLHFIMQFLAWSFAPGNTARDLSHLWISKWWSVMSFPTFWMLPQGWDAPNEWLFWGAFLLNSIVWGLAGTLAFLSIKKLL